MSAPEWAIHRKGVWYSAGLGMLCYLVSPQLLGMLFKYFSCLDILLFCLCKAAWAISCPSIPQEASTRHARRLPYAHWHHLLEEAVLAQQEEKNDLWLTLKWLTQVPKRVWGKSQLISQAEIKAEGNTGDRIKAQRCQWGDNVVGVLLCTRASYAAPSSAGADLVSNGKFRFKYSSFPSRHFWHDKGESCWAWSRASRVLIQLYICIFNAVSSDSFCLADFLLQEPRLTNLFNLSYWHSDNFFLNISYCCTDKEHKTKLGMNTVQRRICLKIKHLGEWKETSSHAAVNNINLR